MDLQGGESARSGRCVEGELPCAGTRGRLRYNVAMRGRRYLYFLAAVVLITAAVQARVSSRRGGETGEGTLTWRKAREEDLL